MPDKDAGLKEMARVLGINFRARKPQTAAEWQAALVDLGCEVRRPDDGRRCGDL
jgi:hypothetical protein